MRAAIQRGSEGLRIDSVTCAGETQLSRQSGCHIPSLSTRVSAAHRLTPVSDLKLKSNAISSLSRSSSVPAGSKRAIVASNDLTFGFSRMFSACAEARGHSVRVFRSMGEALDWLEAG